MAGTSGRNKPTEKTKEVIARRNRRARKQPPRAAPAISPAATEQKEFLSTNEAAAFLGLAPMTLRHKRWRGDSPPFCRLGDGPMARCYYRRSLLEAYLAAHTFTSNAQTTTPEAAAVAARARGR